MPRDETAWVNFDINREKLDGHCILGYHGLDDGICWGLATEPHHVAVKGMGGTKNEFVLKDKRNIAPACLACHDKYQHDRRRWLDAMSRPPLNYRYDDTPLAHYLDGKRGNEHGAERNQT